MSKYNGASNTFKHGLIPLETITYSGSTLKKNKTKKK